MEEHKIKYFKQDNPGKEYPWYSKIGEAQTKHLLNSLIKRQNIDQGDIFKSIRMIKEIAKPLKKNAEDDGFI